MFIFDLKTPNSAGDFILRLLNMNSDDFITEYIDNCSSDFEQFWSRNFYRIDDVDSNSIKIIAFHVTGSIDNCISIKKEGLKNLQKLLSEKSVLNDMFNKYNLFFDIKNCKMRFKNKIYDISYNKYHNKNCLSDMEELLSNISNRIYYDFCVNGFLVCDKIDSYGTNIHLRPEFILNLVHTFPELKALEDEWIQKMTSYRVNFYSYPNQLHRFNFQLDEYRDPPFKNWSELTENQKILKFILSYAIDRFYNNLGDVYLYVKDDIIIPPNQILSYEKI